MITGGMIAYEDGRKAGTDYTPAQKARVELRFDLGEGLSDAERQSAIAAVQVEAVARVASLLDKPGGAAEPVAIPATQETRRPPGRPKKTEPAFPAATKDDVADAIFGQGRTKAAMAEALFGNSEPVPAMEQRVTEPPVVLERKEQAAVPAALPDNHPSNSEMHAAVQFKLQKLRDPVPIRELIAKYCENTGKPPKLDAIPGEKRRAFFKELENL